MKVRDMKKLLITIIISLLFIMLFSNVAGAQPVNNFEEADMLKILGLFKGTPSGYDLERPSNRAEGAVMLIRLIGMEDYISQKVFLHPFNDVPEWAEPQVGYMFTHKLTNGISKEDYGSYLDLKSIQYVTFLLRALGYDDSLGDFNYPESLEKALDIGLLEQAEYDAIKNSSQFKRDDMVLASFRALQTEVKGLGKTLLQKLIENERSVSSTAAWLLGLYDGPFSVTYSSFDTSETGYIVKNRVELMDFLCLTLKNHITGVEIDFREYSGELGGNDFWYILNLAKKAVQKNTGLHNVYSYSYFDYSTRSEDTDLLSHVKLYVEYYANESQRLALERKVDAIIQNIISDGMSQYDKVEAVHNYVVENTEYQDYFSNADEQIFTAYGALIDGYSLSQGYAEAVNLLLKKAGVQSMIVEGEAYAYNTWNTNAWNIVKIDGRYYHVDAAFDDPNEQEGLQLMRHEYLNITDTEISYSHRWNTTEYPPCTETEHNFYYVNGLVAENMMDYEMRTQADFQNRLAEIHYKIKNFTEEELLDISKIIFKNTDVLSYRSDTDYDMGVVWIYDIEYAN